MESFEKYWSQIKECQSDTFKTKRQLEFTYTMEGDYIIPSRTYYKIAKSDFEKVYNMWPVTGSGEITKIVRGPSYIYSIFKGVII